MTTRPEITIPLTGNSEIVITAVPYNSLDFDIFDSDGDLDRTVTYTTDEVAHFLKESGMLDAISRVR